MASTARTDEYQSFQVFESVSAKVETKANGPCVFIINEADPINWPHNGIIVLFNVPKMCVFFVGLHLIKCAATSHRKTCGRAFPCESAVSSKRVHVNGQLQKLSQRTIPSIRKKWWSGHGLTRRRRSCRPKIGREVGVYSRPCVPSRLNRDNERC